jgi:hypothetical protein
VSSPAAAVFRSSGVAGFSPGISADPRRVAARKRQRQVQIRFTASACTVQTREGLVEARPGDAIVTGIAGEHWRVSRAHFAAKYRAVPPTLDGLDGVYASLPARILAVSMSEEFAVLLADGRSTLNGQPGDWLVDYGDGSLGIVSQSIFPTTYEILP